MKRLIFPLLLMIGWALPATGQHKLPDLPYRYAALEPHIDSLTMYIHYNKHHAAYVNNLNKVLEAYPEWQLKDVTELLAHIDKLPQTIRTTVRNNAGGHYNHSLFWEMLAEPGTTRMSSRTEKALIRDFGSVEAFKQAFARSAMGRFGSGWVWLLQDRDGKLSVLSTPNQDNPLMPFVARDMRIVLALDVWEHAYYLNYQSQRAAYVEAFWNVVNWRKVDEVLK